MRIVIEIPIKVRSSTRVPNKNFRDLCGKPLSYWLLDELVEHCPAEWDIFIDSENESVMKLFRERYKDRIQFHIRGDWFAQDQANGNHLIHQFAVSRQHYDIYVQAYVTAVTLPGKIVAEAVQEFANFTDRYDSMLLATEENGWFWFNGKPINYTPNRPDGLPRSQDATVLRETTGVYTVTREAVLRTGCRVGHRPLFYKIDRQYALDIDTMEDFLEAQRILPSLNSQC